MLYECSITTSTVHADSIINKYNVKYLFLAQESSQLAKEDEMAFRPRLHNDWISLWASENYYIVVQKFVQTENEYQISENPGEKRSTKLRNFIESICEQEENLIEL